MSAWAQIGWTLSLLVVVGCSDDTTSNGDGGKDIGGLDAVHEGVLKDMPVTDSTGPDQGGISKTLTAIRDTDIVEGNCNEDRSALTEPGIGLRNPGNCSATSGSKYHYLVKFDASSIPSTASVSSAVLKLQYTKDECGPPAKISAHAMLVDWAEMATWCDANPTTSTTWAQQGTGTGDRDVAAAATVVVPAQPGEIALDLTSLGASWVSSGGSNHGVVIIAETTATPKLIRIGSRENAGKEPKLVVTYK